MKKILILGLLLLCPQLALAQTSRNPCYTTGAQTTNGVPNCIGVGNTTPLPVILGGSGGAAGSTSNAASNVAPSSTNIPTVAYMYNWDGSAWDQATGLNTGTPTAPSTDILSVQNYPVSPGATAALATSRVVKAASGYLYGFNVSADATLSGAAWWIMVHNTVAAPGAGAVTPIKCYALASGATGFNFSFPTPIAFSTGISITVSTTGCFTQTDSIHAFISGDAQ